MSLAGLFETLKNKDIKLNLDDRGDLRVIGRRDRLDQTLLAEIKERKSVIVNWLKEESMLLRPRIEPRVRETNELPTSFAQQRLWFIDQLGGGSPQYNMPGGLRIRGSFNVDIAERALRSIIGRHEPLRTVFRNGAEGPLQHIRESFDFKLKRLDLSGLASEQQEQQVLEAANADARRPFDLSADLMLRACFIRLSGDEGVLLFNMHHIASDGWSMSILVNEFSALYDGFSKGESNPLPPLVVQYADYAQWQREWLAGEVLERQLSYWEHQLAELPQVHGLALDRPRPALQTFNGALHTFTLDRATLTALKQLALQEQATLFMVLQGVFALLLSRHSDSEDIVLGTPVANRLQKELEPLVGFFVNTLVLRTDCAAGRSFREYLRQIKSMNLNAQAHQDVPFEYLVERLKPQRSTSHSALFQIMFSMNTNEAGTANLPELSLRPLRSEQVLVKFDLMLDVLEDADGLWLSFAYNTDLFDEWSIERLGEHLQNLTRGVVANPDEQIELLPLLSEREQQHLLYELNETTVAYPRESCLQELFEAQVELRPESVALVFGDSQLSYRELNEQANQVAHYLREQGVGPDTLVGLCMERLLEMVVGLLGILKAGGAYVPLDPSYPPERLAYMIADSAPAVVLTQDLLGDRLPLTNVRSLRLDADKELLGAYPTHNPRLDEVGLTSEHLAYVIYTSGSTGRPKGVMVEHRQVQHLLASTEAEFQFGAQDVWTLFHSYAFDFSVWELWGALAYGGQLVVVPKWVSRSPEDFYRLLCMQRVTVLNQTPSAFTELAVVDARHGEELALRVIVFGGEALNLSGLKWWVDRHGDEAPALINMYGITETTVHVTYRRIRREDITRPAGSVIGRPLAGLRVYLLDAHQRLVPEGTPGEMYVGGGGVSRGYLNREELTAARFIDNPYVVGERLYRSGDLARYVKGGELEYLGRTDNQVKLRGFRIELGEIEQQLAGLVGVNAAAVIAQDDDVEERRLVAYVVPSDYPAEEEAQEAIKPKLIASYREALATRLPDYMVPARFVVMDQLPLTPNGKVDRKALPAPDDSSLLGEYVAPGTETEIALAGIWANLLKLDPNTISASANFFELGGHSLLSVRLVTEIRAQWNVELQIREIFETPQLSALAVAIERSHNQVLRPRIEPRARETNELPTSFAQQRLWFIDQLGGGSPQYNMPGALRIHGSFSEDIAERALHRIIERHEPLRTVFRNGKDGPLQHIRESFNFHLKRIDLRGRPGSEQEQMVLEATNVDAAKPFDLSADLMLRACFIRLSEEEGVLLFNMHHIASDGWSMGILVNEFSTLYEAFSQGHLDPLTPLEVRYADYAQWQREWLAGEVLERQLGYWEQQLAELPQVHGLALDRPRPAVQTFNGARHTLTLDRATLTALKALARQEQATLFMVLQGVFALLLSRHSNSEDIVLGTPVANRLQKELEPLVGFFVNTLVLRSDCRAGRSFREYLGQIKSMNLDAQANQDVPFEYLVERLKPQRSTSHTALFQVLFSMNTNEAGTANLPELSLTPLRSEQVVVKFDLTLDALEDADGLWLSFAYNTDLFDEWSIERLGEHLQNLARGVVANPDEQIELLPLLSEREQQYLLHELNETTVAYPRESCLHELFEAQVELRPEAAALVFEDQRLSYRQLNEQSNQLAHYLREQGVGPDSLVGLCVERSLAMVVGMLGILKAGGAYVPLDPNYPQEQLVYMLEDCTPAVLLTQASIEERLPLTNVPRLRLDVDKELLDTYPTDNPRPAAVGLTAEHLAYLIYTSGSTGRPKGVMVEHHSVVNLAMNLVLNVGTSTENGWGWVASYAFDASVKGLAQMMMGRTLVILTENEKTNARAMLGLLERQRIGVLDCTPSVLELWLDLGLEANLPDLVLGGEAISPPLWQRLIQWQQQYGRRAINLYGPTECCVDTTGAVIETETPHIGRPWGNIRCYVLDAGKNLAPQGSVGELYIGGEGLARGYLNQPQMTAERFVHPGLGLSDDPAARLYKTGDLVRYRADGNLEFIGRTDDQVKLRGFRIELGEIQHQLARLPGIDAAVVIAREDEPGDKRLVAYVTLEENSHHLEGLDHAEIIASFNRALRLRLPDYMLPSAFVILDAFPLTANGKLNRKALSAPGYTSLNGEYVAPGTTTEEALQAIWQGVLSIPSLSVLAGFFDSGGHSILAIHLIAKANEHFGNILEVRDIFQMQTIREMAAYLDSHQHLKDEKKTSSPANLLELKKQRSPAKPLFLVHPVGGYAHCYLELAPNLDYPGPVFGLQADGTRLTIEAMAQQYIETIKVHQPNGSYLLGGWSMGGTVAYEMARQLNAAQEDVDLLVMFDSFCPNTNAPAGPMSVADEKALLQTMASELGITDEGLSSAERDALGEMSLERLMTIFVRLGTEQNRLPEDFGLEYLSERYDIVLKNSRAVRAYRALPLDIEIQLIRAQENRNPDWSLGWGTVARKVTVRELRGNHFSLVRQPNVVELGKVVSKLMSGHAMQREVAVMF